MLEQGSAYIITSEREICRRLECMTLSYYITSVLSEMIILFQYMCCTMVNLYCQMKRLMCHKPK